MNSFRLSKRVHPSSSTNVFFNYTEIHCIHVKCGKKLEGGVLLYRTILYASYTNNAQ